MPSILRQGWNRLTLIKAAVAAKGQISDAVRAALAKLGDFILPTHLVALRAAVAAAFICCLDTHSARFTKLDGESYGQACADTHSF